MNTVVSIILLPILLPSVILGSLAAVIYAGLELGFAKTKDYIEGYKT